MSQFTTILFDLDGTLMHTAPDLAGAANELRQERNLPLLPAEVLTPVCSYGGRGLLKASLNLTPEDAEYKTIYDHFIDLYKKRLVLLTEPFAGMRELLKDIVKNNATWGVVTNKAKELAQPIVDASKFDPAPLCMVSASEVGVLKPDPACLYLACERLGVDPKTCVYIGDSDRDIIAGNTAGMTTITAGFGYIPADEDANLWPANYYAESVTELHRIINQLTTNAD